MNKAFLAVSLALFLTACDSFSKKPPLPGVREIYLDFTSGDLLPDPDFKGKKVSVPAARPLKAFPQALINFDTEHVPYVATLSESPVWSLSIGEGETPEHRFLGHPVSDGHVIFVSDTLGKISAVKDLGKDKGAEILWTFDSIPEEARDSAGCATLAFYEGTLFVATAIGDIIALDPVKAADGQVKIKWRTSFGAPIRSMPAVKDGRLFVTGINGMTAALDAVKGTLLWTHQGFTEVSSIQGGASPVVKDDLVVSTYSSGEIFVMKAESDVPLWSDTMTTALRSDSISSIPHIVGNPIVDGNILYVISHGGRMAAFDLSTGLTSWQQDIGSIRSPLLIGQVLFVLDNNNRVVCLDKSSGKVHWVSPLPVSDEKKALLWTAPVAVNDQLVFGSSGGDLVFMRMADGTKVKSFQLKDGIVSQPIVVNDHLYLLLSSGQLIRH